MKYGILFSVLSILIAFYAFVSAGWFLVLLWPAISFGVVGLAYLFWGHRVFGKRRDGTMRIGSVVLLLPYLVYLWSGWHAIRLLSRERAYDSLTNEIWIGRRLLSSELPAGTQTVVDLTSEFPEPTALRSAPSYISAPMLDASSLSAQSLVEIVSSIAVAKTPIYLHCAQGHGRTGLVAALLLISRGEADDVDSAIAIIKSVRPGVGLNRFQLENLRKATAIIRAASSSNNSPQQTS